MQVQDIFEKDLFRSINGVVKAEQLEESIIWQELEEYVVTKELKRHLETFITAYLKVMDNPRDPAITSKMGAWVSGFFGSGKSHFIKILSYLLENKEVKDPISGITKKAIDFFEDKIEDNILLGDLKRVVSSDTDVILFNIDTKAASKDGRDAIFQVFLRVFNEMQGFSGDHPHIAKMENYLKREGKLEVFQQAFKELDGRNWVDERDAYEFRQSQVVEALSKALNQSLEDGQKWFDKATENFSMNIEKFAKNVKSYLDQKGAHHRIIFLVDEVGQFIGSDTSLMLNLQTISENLGTFCEGRAWVMVTSQEDIDTVLGEFNTRKINDFSKIQGRFLTRVKLSSSNTDEVIQSRILKKKESAKNELRKIFDQKGAILKHQLSFETGATLKNYTDPESFINNYPFVPYHFELIQKVFESIRKAGATGSHLAAGERSQLDAFQLAAQSIAKESLNKLAPLSSFYPAIEGFLETAISRTIIQAATNPSLQPFDIDVLKTLFLVRYVDIVRTTVANLVTLLIDEIDADRIRLRKQIEESLLKLEQETLINRNGELYFFLTNEERDVSQEIKQVTLEGNEDTEKISELLFEDVLKSSNKFRYLVNKTDYNYSRFCDGHPYKGGLDHDLRLELVTPLSDNYTFYNDAKCLSDSLANGGRVVVKMGDDPALGGELGIWLKTDKYIRNKHDASASSTIKKILTDQQGENSERLRRLIDLLNTLFREADYFAIGKSIVTKASNPKNALEESFLYLIENIFFKLGYLKTIHDTPQQEIKAIFQLSDVKQTDFFDQEADAIQEIVQFIGLKNTQNVNLLLSDLVTHFKSAPFGWNDWEIVILVAKLKMSNELTLMLAGGDLTSEKAANYFCKTTHWKQISILKKIVTEPQTLEKARKLGNKLFAQVGPNSEVELYKFLKDHLTEWTQNLDNYKGMAERGNYPGIELITASLSTLQKILPHRDSYQFIQAFNQSSNDLEDLSADFHDLKDFYQNQISTWDRLLEALQTFGFNQEVLQSDRGASSSLKRLKEIRYAEDPYGMIKEIDALIASIKPVNEQLVEEKRDAASQAINPMIEQIKSKLQEVKADSDTSNLSLKPLQDIKKRIQAEVSIPNIHYAQHTAGEKLEEILDALNPPSDQPIQKTTAIYPARLVQKTYLETPEDIKEFIETLEQKLMRTIENNEKIQIK